jgi:hypothetical protein
LSLSSLSSKPMPVMPKEEKPCNYLCPSLSTLDDDDALVDPSDRTLIVDWMYSIVDGCWLELALVATAMGLVDRFLSRPDRRARAALRDRRRFQLVAVAALSLCLRADARSAAGSAVLARAHRALYSGAEVAEAEADLLRGPAAGLRAPTSLQLARRFLSLAFPGAVPLEESRYSCILGDVQFQLEYAVRDYYFTLQWPRTVAMAAILNALDEVTGLDRHVMCRVFPPFVKEHFPSPSEVTDVMAAKHRLRTAVGWDELAEDEAVVVSET